jgi:hypothetical protein
MQAAQALEQKAKPPPPPCLGAAARQHAAFTRPRRGMRVRGM